MPAGDYMLTGGELTVDANVVTIVGAGMGATRDLHVADVPGPVFDITGVTVTISHLTMEGGRHQAATSAATCATPAGT